MSKHRLELLLAAASVLLILAACGGGGGNSGTNSSNSSSGVSTSSSGATAGDQTAATYSNGSIEASTFTQVNQARQQCGLPPYLQNTYLDKAAVAHANYMMDNNTVSDSETSGLTGYTGANYLARAVAAGYPSGVSVGGESTGFYTAQTLTNDEYAQHYVYGFLSGVYHIHGLMTAATDVGIGSVSQPYNGFPEMWAAVTFGNPKAVVINGPLTFPCQGTTGVAYAGAGEIPTPPNTSSQWGTPVGVFGNVTDSITLTSGTMTDSSGTSITLQLLDSANDTNKELQPYQATAYPASALKPNTQYSVSITGTYNGTPFSRSFSFTTGNIVG